MDDPLRSDLTTFFTEGTEVVSATETGTGIVLELNEPFWSGSGPDVYRRAAQVVFTLNGLEEGREVTLLHGLTPGTIVTPSGRRLKHPLEISDFTAVRPWIEVLHPVAGELVANPIPVRVALRDDVAVRVEVVAGGVVVGRGDERSVSWSTEAARGIVRVISHDHHVDVPVRFIQE